MAVSYADEPWKGETVKARKHGMLTHEMEVNALAL
jgi:hypothetical protein